MRLWLARHARPLVQTGVCYGVTDVKADAAHTREVAQALAGSLPAAGLVVRTSPLRRCAQLATALGKHRPDLYVVPDTRLQEMNFGTWEAHAWAEIPRSALDAWIADFAGHPFGGADTIRGFMGRVNQALRDTQQQAALEGADDALWITHAGVVRAVQLLMDGTGVPATPEQWPVQAIACGQWRVVELPGAGPSPRKVRGFWA